MSFSPEHTGYSEETMAYMADRHAKLGPEIYQGVLNHLHDAGVRNACDVWWVVYSITPTTPGGPYREILILDEATGAPFAARSAGASVRITINDLHNTEHGAYTLTEDFAMSLDGRNVRYIPGGVREFTGSPNENFMEIRKERAASNAAVFIHHPGYSPELSAMPGYAGGVALMSMGHRDFPGVAVTPFGDGAHIVDQLYSFDKAQRALEQLDGARIIGLGKL